MTETAVDFSGVNFFKDRVVQDDPFDGLARALADGLLCLGGFAVLGRYLGLRPARAIR